MMRTKISGVMIATVLLALAIGVGTAKADQAAVVDIDNNAFMLSDRYYGSSTQLRNLVGGLLTEAVSEHFDDYTMDFRTVREEAAEYFEESHPDRLDLSSAEQLEFGRAGGYDYLVTGSIMDTNAKESAYYRGMQRLAKHSLWCTMKIEVYDAATGETVLSRIYEGKHEFTGEAAGLSPVTAGMDLWEFADSDIGAPFYDIVFEQFLPDLEEAVQISEPVVSFQPGDGPIHN